MAKSYVSAVIEAPIEKVWACVRDFGKLPYFSEIDTCVIDGGLAGDTVGAVRRVRLKSGFVGAERLIGLSDLHHRAAYQLTEGEGPDFKNYVAELKLLPITLEGTTFLQWWSTYDVSDEKRAEVGKWIEEGIYGNCISGIKRIVERSK